MFDFITDYFAQVGENLDWNGELVSMCGATEALRDRL